MNQSARLNIVPPIEPLHGDRQIRLAVFIISLGCWVRSAHAIRQVEFMALMQKMVHS